MKMVTSLCYDSKAPKNEQKSSKIAGSLAQADLAASFVGPLIYAHPFYPSHFILP